MLKRIILTILPLKPKEGERDRERVTMRVRIKYGKRMDVFLGKGKDNRILLIVMQRHI